MNWYHDELYRLGFTEPARNYQTDNFGRGGVANDRVSAEGQDSSGTNNANFSAGADGVRGRMQMFLWTGPTPDRDGTGDADIMIHEVTHGTSNRLHGNNAGLSLNMSRAMGEGWSDFYAHSLLSEPSDSVNGLHAAERLCPVPGIRRRRKRELLLWYSPLSESRHGRNRRPDEPSAQPDDFR